MTKQEALPLSDISVIELGNIVSAPFASLLLADLGADVVKIERPGVGDLMRSAGESGEAVVNALNRNKRSLALDLQSDRGRKAYHDLASEADVVIENLGPGVADRLKIGYDDLKARNTDLVYLSIKGFHSGPYGDRPGMDMVAESMSGLAAMTGNPGGGPVRVGTSIADIGSAMYGVIGVLTALRERDRTGKGQLVDATLFESAAQWMGYWMTFADMTGQDHPPLGTSHPAFSLYDIFETTDSDRWVFVGVTSDRHWPAFCEAVDRPDLLADRRFETPESRFEHESELVSIAREELTGWNREELVDALLAEGVPAAPVNKPSELLNDEHLEESGMIITFGGYHNGMEKRLRTVKTPLSGDRIATEQRLDTPRLGEHSREVVAASGYDEAEIDDLLEEGVIELPAER
ncbi:CAIB/BAIF family protein (plasmid) [Halalkalicoccus jeotgali B3]|uniref:CAIB/BAIF family protein n=1 Tax=Halalkalicoccus jeotgali (strain DSM 18796 / CECT 7217 / JCM 14584 / KCTC 4019 / B3) TaxID=795797 RepID=D8JCX6_HALJB|nr:CaiB/BaiF CoA-transferase family protein [Halalkalicoccus jeotgali]ADJ16871.1 CAIB/BAIF family protein [Halalkalicoccus jeotgali B3]